MNLNEIKEIIKKDNGKFIIVEDGEPVMVILSFGDYQKILNLKKEGRDSERFVPLGEAIQESKGDFTSDFLNEEEEEVGEAARSPRFAGEAGPESSGREDEEEDLFSEDKEEPMKIEDLPF